MAGALLAATTCQVNRVVLSGGSYFASNFGADAYCYLIIDQDGKTYKKQNSELPSLVNSTTDWVRPTSEAPGTYQVRVTNKTGDTTWSSTATEDTWYTLSTSDFLVWVYDTSVGFGGASITFDIEIRKGTGPTLASASYTLSADREDF